MTKRWIIRSLFLLPLACFVGAWLASYWRYFGVFHEGDEEVGLSIDGGRVGGLWVEYASDYPGWRTRVLHPRTNRDWTIMDVKSKFHCLGFGFESIDTPPRFTLVTVPLWFPTLLLLAHNWFVWQRTKPMPLGHAFPVQPTAKSGESKSCKS